MSCAPREASTLTTRPVLPSRFFVQFGIERALVDHGGRALGGGADGDFIDQPFEVGHLGERLVAKGAGN